MKVKEYKETKVNNYYWDLSAMKWRMEATGLKLLMDGFKEKRILGRKCHKCGTVYVPGPTYCRKCMIDINEIVEVKPEGILGPCTINLADIRGNPLEQITATGCVKLDGSDSWMMGKIEGWSDWREIKPGIRVRVKWADVPKGALSDLMHFEVVK